MTKEKAEKKESKEEDHTARDFLKTERNYAEEAKLMAKNIRKKSSLLHHLKGIFSNN